MNVDKTNSYNKILYIYENLFASKFGIFYFKKWYAYL